MGENIARRHGFKEFIINQGCDIVQLDVRNTGGLLESKKIADLADIFYLPMAAHNTGSVICNMATAHWAGAVRDFLAAETVIGRGNWMDDVIVHEGPIVKDGTHRCVLETGTRDRAEQGNSEGKSGARRKILGIAARYPSLAYIAPFGAFLAFLALDRVIPLGAEWLYPARVIVVLAIILLFSRSVLDFRVKNALGSILLGVAVFVDLGRAGCSLAHLSQSLAVHQFDARRGRESSVPQGVRSNLLFLIFRTVGCVLLVPVIEELFWRGWLARWLIDGDDFRSVPFGAYTSRRLSGWDPCCSPPSMVRSGRSDLIAGVAYNWWMIRTKSLATACSLTP